MKKLVILHDISSYYDFQVLEHLQSMLNDVDVIPVEISYPYKYVMRNLHKFCYQVKPDAIIGLSAGAMFAQQMHGYRKFSLIRYFTLVGNVLRLRVCSLVVSLNSIKIIRM